MFLKAPAKINLHLRVGPKRADGFHGLLTWMCSVALFDSLELTARDGAGVSLSCNDPAVPCDERNLVSKAAEMLRRVHLSQGDGLSAQSSGLAVALDKRIPAGAGLGGGSSDAARMLLGLNRFWRLDRSVARLSDLAAGLGSDVPFFLHGPSSVCQGRGEAVWPISRPAVRWVVLMLPEISMPTPEVYRQFDAMGQGKEDNIRIEPDWKAWVRLDAEGLLQRLMNDLEPPAFAIRPELGELRASVQRTAGRIVRMSGSGSSLFTLFDDGEMAQRAADAIGRQHGVRTVAVSMAPDIDDDLAS